MEIVSMEVEEDPSKKGQFRCENCSRTYKRLTDYNTHKKTCSTTKNVQCTICKMAFFTIFGLRQHMRKLHALVKQYVCEECGRNFYVLEDLEKHRSNHKEQQCTECGKTYANIKQLRRHLDCHSSTSYVCTVCGISLNTRHTLNHHMKKHAEILNQFVIIVVKSLKCPKL
uniref:C2H2-type domain-containing protein n=1 Tax=Megaselia scalaris TaxID=36166 RepID=T1GIQ6_MEGSC